MEFRHNARRGGGERDAVQMIPDGGEGEEGNGAPARKMLSRRVDAKRMVSRERESGAERENENPSCCNLQGKDNEPSVATPAPERHRPEPVIPTARNVAAEGRLSYFKRFAN